MTSGRRSRIAAQVARATQAAKAQAQNDVGLISTQVASTADAGANTYAAASCITQVDVPIDPALQALSVPMPTQEVPPPHKIETPIAPELLMEDSCARIHWKEVEDDGDCGVEGRHKGAQMKMKCYNGGEGGGGDDSEWEYDWDDCEVHYVTLDLTIPTPLVSHLAPTTIGAEFATGAGRGTTTSASANASKIQTSSSKSTKSHSAQTNDHTSKHHTHYPHKFQLSSLVSQNPLVSYHNRIYSCEWTEPLGTEMFIESTAPTFSTSTSTLASSQASPTHPSAPPVGTLVGISQTRLHGYPAIVVPKEGAVDHRLTRVDKGGKIAQGEDGMAGRTAFWKRLEEVKKRRKEREGREGGEDSGDAGESGGEGSSGANRRGNAGAGVGVGVGVGIGIGDGQGEGGARDEGGVRVSIEDSIERRCGRDRKSYSGRGKPMGSDADGDRDAEDEEESNEDSDINSNDDDEYEYGNDHGGPGTHREHQQSIPVGEPIYPRQQHLPHPGISFDANPVTVTNTSVGRGHLADIEGDIEMGGALR